MATSSGDFSLNRAKVSGNANLFEGNTIETQRAISRLQLADGAKVQLGMESRAKVFARRLVLEKGSSKMETAAGFQIEAASLSIAPATSNSSGQIVMQGPRKILVAALSGGLRVANSSGVLIANVAPGTPLEFSPQEQTAGSSYSGTTITGCLRKSEGHYFLTDETTKVEAELQAGAGIDLEKEVGHRIRVSGAPQSYPSPLAGATQLLMTSKIDVLAKKCTSALPLAAIVAGVAVVLGASIGTAVAVSGGGSVTPLSPGAP